ncbi:MAG: bacteriocin fulvocin C-related protein [Flavobacterium sp.]|nr:bacteriocin fulvocin C-related protein [Flavobacterium sp.]
MKNLLFGLIAIVLFSLTVNAQGTLRADFLKGKTQDQLIDSFNQLPTGEKNALWIEKMDQLLNQKLPVENLQLIQQMRDSHLNKNLDGFKKAALALAEITPDEDFTDMFNTLSNYNFNGSFVGKSVISDLTIKSINDFGLSQEVITGRLKDCNCRWSCDWYVGGSSGNCHVTSSGCGFMWAFECTGYVGPRP